MNASDTALIDACVECLVNGCTLQQAFSNSAALMSLPPVDIADRMGQVRTMSTKLVELSRPERRLSLLKLIRKLMSDEKMSETVKKK
jgi:hypothetical protein